MNHPISTVMKYSLGGALFFSVLDISVRKLFLRIIHQRSKYVNTLLQYSFYDWKSYVNGGLCTGFILGLWKADTLCQRDM
jgi:hypothetical protein